MWIFISQTFISGIIFWIFGIIVFNLSINKKNFHNSHPITYSNNKHIGPIGIDLAFFTTGIIIYIILHYFNLD